MYFLFLTLPDESQIPSKGQIWSAMRLNGKAVTKSLNGKSLQQMIKLKEDLRFGKKNEPRGLSAPALGLYTCV